MLKKTIKLIIAAIKEICYLILWLSRWLKSIINYKMFASKCKVVKSREKIIIVGNGPSAATFDFFRSDIIDYSVLCVNSFAIKNSDFFKIKPRYYCIIDDAYFKTHDLDSDGIILKECFEKVDWEMSIILLSHQYLRINNKNINFIYLNSNKYNGTLLKYTLFRYNLANNGFQNVINASVFFTITAKAKEVYLIGVENDWHKELIVDINNDVIREYTHFYGIERVNVVKNGQIEKGELYKYFYWYYLTLKNHYEYSKYADFMGVKIYNITPKSYIDVYDRKEF